MPKRSSKILQYCKKINTKKYTSRSSPPYSAADCPNQKFKGNDGKYYISLPTYETNVYRWYPYSKELMENFKKKVEETTLKSKYTTTKRKKIIRKIIKNHTIKNNK